ncbi:sensor histidine kinase N-terminal domain-containing protein [Marinomonas epiphytica]
MWPKYRKATDAADSSQTGISPETLFEESRALKRAPSLRFRLILAGVVVIGIIAGLAVNLVFNYSQKLADLSFDRLLRSAILQLDENIIWVHDEVSIDIPWSAFATLAQANEDRIFYKVETLEKGMITGYDDLPSLPPKPAQEGEVIFYDQLYSGEKVRFAWLEKRLTESETEQTVRIILGQTRLSREAMASSVTQRAVQVIVLIALVAISMIIIGSHLVLRPLHRIERDLEERSLGDLTPIAIDTPKETHHLKVAINHFMARLQTNLQQLENYTTDAAHQLRTPLASLKALAENARDQTTPHSQHQALENIVEQCDTLSRTVTLLLNQAVVSHRIQTQKLAVVDLVEVVSGSCRDQALVALDKGVRLSLETSLKEALILGEGFALSQMLQNLIENAVRYTKVEQGSSAEVIIRLIEGPGFYRLSVIDFGEGISDVDKSRVFERFYRGRYDIAGSGVGLSLVKDIVDYHAASVVILDTVPKGTSIQIDIKKYVGGRSDA